MCFWAPIEKSHCEVLASFYYAGLLLTVPYGKEQFTCVRVGESVFKLKKKKNHNNENPNQQNNTQVISILSRMLFSTAIK